MHKEIINRKTIEDVIFSPCIFEELQGKLLLFKRDSINYVNSGMCTAALLDYEKSRSVLAIITNTGWRTFKLSKDELRYLLYDCEVVVGKTPEESFMLSFNQDDYQ